MARAGQRKCLSCGQYFDPDPRVSARQQFCSAAACRQVSKSQSQERWRCKPENLDYFRGPLNTARVQAWRAAHPGYARRPRPVPEHGQPLQDEWPTQEHDCKYKSPKRTLPPLQDLLGASSPVLAGLIALLFEVRLQDEIAAATRRLVQLGTDVLNGGGDDETQASATAAAGAARSQPVQLD